MKAREEGALGLGRKNGRATALEGEKQSAPRALIAACLLLYIATICVKILYSAETVVLLSALSET